MVFLFRKRFWLTALKVIPLLVVGYLALLQIPELRYDFGPREPMPILKPEALRPWPFRRAVFARVHGQVRRAFVQPLPRYHMEYGYLVLEDYGPSLVVRTFEPVLDEEGQLLPQWRQATRFVGKLKPLDRQPFAHRIRENYHRHLGVDLPPDAMLLMLYDVPAPSGWQIGSLVFCLLTGTTMVYLFFLRGRAAASRQSRPTAEP